REARVDGGAVDAHSRQGDGAVDDRHQPGSLPRQAEARLDGVAEALADAVGVGDDVVDAVAEVGQGAAPLAGLARLLLALLEHLVAALDQLLVGEARPAEAPGGRLVTVELAARPERRPAVG